MPNNFGLPMMDGQSLAFVVWMFELWRWRAGEGGYQQAIVLRDVEL